MTTLRIIIAAVGFLGIFVAPSWVPLVCIVLLSLRFRAWEGIVIGLVLDLMWLPLGLPYVHVPFYTLVSILIVWGLEPLRLELLR